MNKTKILIADDMEINRDILGDIFAEQFDIIEAEDGEEAIEKIQHNFQHLALILLDLQMPKKTGLDVLTYMHNAELIDQIPVIMITGESTVDTDVNAYELGAADIIYKPFASAVVMRRALNIIELYEHRVSVEEQLMKRTRELEASKEKVEKSNEFLINALSSVVEFRSQESGEHINRVKKFTNIMLENMKVSYPEYGITDEQIQLISSAAALHDIGKIAIPDDILMKPGKLTDEEFEIMKTHTTQGCKILENFRQEDNEFYKYCYEICRHHHERYDGKGYPDQLVGDAIPIWAQVVSIVDVFDALVSKRVYKSPYAVSEAERMIMDGECGTFSPKIIECFKMAKYEFYQYTEEFGSYEGAE